MDNGQKRKNVIVEFEQIEFIGIEAIKTEYNQ